MVAIAAMCTSRRSRCEAGMGATSIMGSFLPDGEWLNVRGPEGEAVLLMCPLWTEHPISCRSDSFAQPCWSILLKQARRPWLVRAYLTSRVRRQQKVECGVVAIKFSVFLPTGFLMDFMGIPDPVAAYEQMTEITKVADEVGFQSVWLADHMTPAAPVPAGVFESWISLAALARDTERIRLGHLCS